MSDELEFQPQIRLAPLTSWLIGGVADYFCQPTSLDDMRFAQRWAQERRLPITVLGGGSNVLVSDRGVRGLVIGLRKFTGSLVEERENRLSISALAGTPKAELLKTFLRYKLAPALFLAGLPGEVGGGVVMNAGVAEAFTPREFVEITDWVRVLKPTGEVVTLTRDQLQWTYRHCEGWQPGILVEVGLSWPLKVQADVLERVKEANALRLKKQPLESPSCGSVFRNPEGDKAGRLIEVSGLKGHRIGDAQVSEKHANFIVNLGHATATDTRRLIEHVQKTVYDLHGVALKTEVVYLGAW